MPIQSVNPYTNQIVKTFDEISDKQLDHKIAQAHKAYLSWRNTDIKTRAALLQKVAALMLERKSELAGLITLEMGKLIGQSESEIEMCASVYDYYAGHASEFLKDRPFETEGAKAFVRIDANGNHTRGRTVELSVQSGGSFGSA